MSIKYVSKQVILLLMLLLLLSACGRERPERASEQAAAQATALADGEKLRVVATTSVVGDVVAQVGGEAIELTVLILDGQEPHSYDPSASDLATAAQAHVIFVNGLHLEETLLADLEQAAEGVPIVAVSAGIEPLEGDDAEDGHRHAPDPHVWFDIDHVEHWTENIEATLSELAPANEEQYEANAKAYAEQLAELEGLIHEAVEKIPPANRKLVTNHDSFRYFARAYDFEIIGALIPSFSTSSEPSASDFTQLIATIRQTNVPAIFIESTATDQLAQIVVEETGVNVYNLYSGALGPPGSGADSYIGMMRTNVETIQEALGE